MSSAVHSASAIAGASGSSSPARGTMELSQGPQDGTATVRQQKKRGKANALLRDYYGLGGGLSNANEDPADPDSVAFDKRAAYKKIVSSSSLPQLLKSESDLLTEIRDLDGERQSLVYNHHHELIAASETIRKMKARAESLDGSLDALRTSFSSISRLSAELAAPVTANTQSSSSVPQSSDPADDVLDVRISGTDGEGERIVRLSATMQAELLSISSLPARLRETLALHSSYSNMQVTPEALASAEKMWGRTEPTIAKWVEAGVGGAKEIASECRAILREAAGAAERRAV